MYWKIIDSNRYNVLKKIIENINLKEYYLAGGTALALQTGIRNSYDFDFFVQDNFDENLLVDELNKLGNLQVNTCREGTVHAILDNVKLTFLYFPNKLLEPKIELQEIKGLYIASIKDIAIMKLIAISQRGTKKDFFDLYYICNNFDISIKEILELLDKKYEKNKINYIHIIQSLSYFEDAEDEELPETYINCNWNDIKKFYIEEQRNLEKITD